MSKTWQASYTHNDFIVATETVAYNGHFKVVDQQLRFKMYSGEWSAIVPRVKLVKEAAVVVLLYHPEENAVLLVEQFRIGAMGHTTELASPWLLEPVAGLIELNDTVEQTAYREVAEETGCKVLELLPICKYLASPGMSNELAYVMCGRINKYSLDNIYGVVSESENIKPHILPVSVAFELLENNTIIAASGIIALQWLQINLTKLQQSWR